jgi:hypothetical protein
MKRNTATPEPRSQGELKQNLQKKYTAMEKYPSKINPIFLQDNYCVKKEG